MGRFRHDDYIELTMHFGCNLKCEHCMLAGSMDRLAPVPPELFNEVLRDNRTNGRWKGLILTGAEITLRRDLPELARRARASGFEHVRIQTHGMRLADESYCRELVRAGVDEFYVSLTASTAERHDDITRVPGSFDRTWRGLRMLDRFDGVVTLTNTVITQRSYRDLPGLVRRLVRLKRLVQMEFWTYWPMGETDDKNLIAPHHEVRPYLRQAISLARQHGRDVEVKNFPECLLGEDGGLLDNSQSTLVIDPAFWPEFMRNGFHQCIHRPVCGSSRCLGLNTAYVNKYGWEVDGIRPLAAPAEATSERKARRRRADPV